MMIRGISQIRSMVMKMDESMVGLLLLMPPGNESSHYFSTLGRSEAPDRIGRRFEGFRTTGGRDQDRGTMLYSIRINQTDRR